jgi:dTMP kinase
MTLSGKLIVIDGADGAGKGTQTELLVKRLGNDGQKVETFDFPRYEDGVFGKLVGECLSGKHGDFRHMDPYVASLPFTLDRVSVRDDIDKALIEGNVVVCNRYTPSNIAYQAAKFPAISDQNGYITFMETGEYGELVLPEPDLVIYLSVPIRVSQQLLLKKEERGYLEGAKKDQHEADSGYQADVQKVFERLCEERNNWKKIVCGSMRGGGEIFNPEEIHDMVYWEVRGLQ